MQAYSRSIPYLIRTTRRARRLIAGIHVAIVPPTLFLDGFVMQVDVPKEAG
jgi:hypothetical protein